MQKLITHPDCLLPNHNDAQIYHIFEGLLLSGVSLLVILTKGEVLGLTAYSDNFLFFMAAFIGVFAGLLRIITSYYQDYFAKYAVATKSFLLIVEGSYILGALSVERYEYVSLLSGLFVVNFIRLVMKISQNGDKVEACFTRFSFYLLVLFISRGIEISFNPSAIPFKNSEVFSLIENNQFVFVALWFLVFVPVLLYSLSPLGRHSKVTSFFYTFVGMLTLVVATEFSIQSNISLAYASYMIGIFVIFVAWWHSSKSKIAIDKSFIFMLSLIWISASVLLGLFSVKVIQEKAKEQMADRMLTSLIIIESEIEKLFDQNATLMRSVIQKTPVLAIAEENDTEAAIAVARQVYDGGGYLRGVNFINREGIAVGNYPRNSLIIGTNFSTRDYYINTKEKLTGQIGEFFINLLGNPNLAQTEPFFKDNDFAGMLVQSIDLEKYSVEVSSQLEVGSVLTVVDKNNIVIIKSDDQSLIGSEADLESSSSPVNISNDNVVVRRGISNPDWDMYLASSSKDILGDISSISVFLTILLVVNGFLSIAAVVSITRKTR